MRIGSLWTRRGSSRDLLTIAGLTLFSLAVHGFHPYAEDGGLYVAGVEKLLDPSLFPAWTEFVTEHLRFSVFARSVAFLVQHTGLTLPAVIFAIYFLSIFATLWSAAMMLARLTQSSSARLGGVALLACWLTLPIAGTSLLLMDPYVTARSFSTPLILAATAWAIDALRGRSRAWLPCAGALLAAAALHPLMAGYGIASVIVLAFSSPATPQSAERDARGKTGRWGPWVLLLAAVLLAALVRWNTPGESAAYKTVALTRYYWFPGLWAWYEQAGLVAPLLLLGWLGGWRSRSLDSPEGESDRLARAGIVLGGIAIIVALLFCQPASGTHLVARLQPLRSFGIVYTWMILLLGAWLGGQVLRRDAARWAALFVICGGTMFYVQRSTFPNSAHIEAPWNQPSNGWENAFLWARDHTPKDALFALDARYITRGSKEDAQCFRPIAERSALADYSKDGGEASITPGLTSAWSAGEEAQSGLEKESDRSRLLHLRPFGVSWVVLEAPSATRWFCPYSNGLVKVCRLP